jgi:hypothetical protein
MTGSRFPGSRVIASDHLPRNARVSSGIYGRRLSAYSCGGSRGVVYQAYTHRIPLVSPCGHYRSRTWHRIVLRVNRRIGIHLGLPSLLNNWAHTLLRGHADDRMMSPDKTPIWRDDIDSLEFLPGDCKGRCMMHRRAFRTLMRAPPSPQQCLDFFNENESAFQAAAHAKVLRTGIANGVNFHLTSRDVTRQLKI